MCAGNLDSTRYETGPHEKISSKFDSKKKALSVSWEEKEVWTNPSNDSMLWGVTKEIFDTLTFNWQPLIFKYEDRKMVLTYKNSKNN